ncbi:tRNA (adenosine(37)-N6)-threonylcarbamoyltransferase complex ATPase subunit type 1 TsaE [Parasphingopyxis algicola]|uniref:tRNA (adenosine(37)-N6)-threonylcarbamoyltransferase complex ATPase subunit type 1 TsaE n=1 Tax=Parasphingopyxis algicola TaxID=2026624 RepID=UPI0015A4BA69|nr:tRNA (adenosine(37)-N6)-threonylcarbamoyltransferase complex ATPase subunit type 1 TsaE [Parasphingopyxis algicola]QLC24258.1 tRNA (adenosine(37)-N6)-threonylcarbamoyltransferase complex ATPase subunit type 1 TsaE [Parasphingopyxis algicola]
MGEELILADEQATLAFGARIASILRPGDAIALFGDLGAGKTTLARGILQAFGLETEAPSPTFAIVQPYEPPETRIPVWHIDLYRLEDPEEALELGLDEARREVAMLIEWPERLGAGLWEDALRLHLSIAHKRGAGGDGRSAARRLTATVPPAWETRWPPA